MDTLYGINKTAKVVLVMSPPWEILAPPLGLAYLEAYLLSKGIEVNIVDANAISYHTVSNEHRKFWNYDYIDKWNEDNFFNKIKKNELLTSIEKSRDEILKCNTPLVGFSVNQVNRLFVSELVRRIKEIAPEKTIILGGPGIFHWRERIALFPIKELVDVCVKGEGEETLYEIVDRFYCGENLEQIPGTVKLDKTQEEYPREVIKNLDKLPFPKYKNFDFNLYSGEKIIKILGSRGCVGKCKFCNDRIFLAPYRFRSAENIFEEMQYHYEKNSIQHFVFNDLIINGSPNQLEKLCGLIIESNLNILWDANVLPSRKLISERLIRKAKTSGCRMLMLGIESGSDEVLNKMGKGKFFKAEEASMIMKMLKRYGIKTWINIIVGYPGETEEDFEKTLQFIINHKNYIDQVCSLNTCNIPCGSELRENKEKYGIYSNPEDRDNEVNWIGKGGNTRELRISRLRRIKEILFEYDIPCMQSNEGCFRDISETASGNKLELFQDKRKYKNPTKVTGNKILSNVKTVTSKRLHRSFFSFLILLLLTLITSIVSLYIWTLKKFKGIIIFPGT